jgi:hypothetical protein
VTGSGAGGGIDRRAANPGSGIRRELEPVAAQAIAPIPPGGIDDRVLRHGG